MGAGTKHRFCLAYFDPCRDYWVSDFTVGGLWFRLAEPGTATGWGVFDMIYSFRCDAEIVGGKAANFFFYEVMSNQQFIYIQGTAVTRGPF